MMLVKSHYVIQMCSEFRSNVEINLFCSRSVAQKTFNQLLSANFFSRSYHTVMMHVFDRFNPHLLHCFNCQEVRYV